MRNSQHIRLLFFVCLTVSFCFRLSFAEIKPIDVGECLPDLIFKDILSKEERKYLVIPEKKTFSFKKSPVNFFLIDVFSIYCISCQKQAPIFHEVYSKIENNPELKRKVKMIGIAVGNNQKEVESFKKEYKTPYPVFTDPDFSAYASLGNPRAPYTIFLKKDAKGKYIVVNIHRGKYDSADDVMNDIRDCLYCDPNTYSCGLKGTD